jgi:hypothetical protein
LSNGAKVIPLDPARRARRASRAVPLRERVKELEAALEAARRDLHDSASERPADGLLVTLGRVLQAGIKGFNLQNLAALQRALYFAWHSEETDEFGFDPVFAERVRPLLEFLYAVWWRVEAVD